MHVTVAIPTKRRTEDLAALLCALKTQRLDDGITFEVVVVDNDPSGSACRIVERAQQEGFERIAYVVEAVPGVSAARNRALSLAKGDAVAFIDDDEVPCSKWLQLLVDTMKVRNADIVFGPVVPAYAPGVADWIVRSGVFERRRFPTGQAVGSGDARSGNVLMSKVWLDRQVPGATFDPRLGLTGGEDALFFSRAITGGARAIWCDEAEVAENVPRERATVGYLLRRWFQVGISSCLIARIQHGWSGVVRESTKGVLLFAGGAAMGTVTLMFSTRRAATWYTMAVCGLGKVAGAFGYELRLYAGPGGT